MRTPPQQSSAQSAESLGFAWRESTAEEGAELSFVGKAVESVIGGYYLTPCHLKVLPYSRMSAPATQYFQRQRVYRGIWLIRNTPPVGPYSSPLPRGLW